MKNVFTDCESNWRRGVVAVLASVMMLMLLGVAALTIDVGLMQLVRAELQRTADAAVLAAVQDLHEEDLTSMDVARATALQFVAKNPVLNGRPVQINGISDIVFGRAALNEAETGVEFVAALMPPNAIRVTVHYNLAYTFARVFGLSSKDISAVAMSAVPPPKTIDIVPISLPVPGFGPVDPDIAEHNPGKTSPSEPENGEQYQVGEEVAVFFFGKGPRQEVHLVLDIEGNGVSDINNLLATEESLGGEREPFEVSIGDEFYVWGEGTGNGNFGVKLETRLLDDDPDNNTILMPIVEELADTRDANGDLVGKVRIVDFVAVTLTEVREVEVPDPNNPDKTMTIRVMFGIVVEQFTGSGIGDGEYTLGSVRNAPLLIE